MKKTRKIIQISTDSSEEGPAMFYALCDDGSVWRMIYRHPKGAWERMPDIPQDKAE